MLTESSHVLAGSFDEKASDASQIERTFAFLSQAYILLSY